MGVKIKKYIYKHNADIYLEKIQYSNNIIISLAELITSDYIVLLTNVLLVDYYKIVKDLNLLNINNFICTKKGELIILINRKDIRFNISKIMSYNPEDIFLFNLNDISEWEICSNIELLNPKYLLKSNISDITISFAFLEHECEICLSLEKYNISDVIDYINYITS